MLKSKLTSLTERFYKSKLKSDRELWEEIQAYQHKTKSTGAKYATLYNVYHSVLRLKPRGIVECGTGLSTVVICKAIEKICRHDPSYKPSFVSLESEEFYWKHALDLLPEKYRPMVEIRLSGLTEDAFSMFRGVRYENIPAGPYDFVFVDGPSYQTKQGGLSFCFDLIKFIEMSADPVYAVIDTRVSTVFVLQRLLGKKIVRYSDITRVGIVNAATKNDLAVLSEPPSSHFKQGIFDRAVQLDIRRAS